MTIAAAWVRTLKKSEELIVVSDSRLNGGGMRMDCGQKVHSLPRSDAFICFAGNTMWAYPLIHQVISAISTYDRSASRAQDIVELKTHVLKVFESLRGQIADAIPGDENPDAEFIFGGYSWKNRKFMIWHIYYQPKMKAFEAHPAKEWKGKQWVFAGDAHQVQDADRRFRKILEDKKARPHEVEDFKFDWEPGEAICDMLKDAQKGMEFKTSSIGGAPQMLKVYEFLSSSHFAVKWQNHDDSEPVSYVSGRKPLGFETPDLWVFDPDTLTTSHPLYSSETEE
ncbi:hypothetical protein [Photobacterium andalusiense]|uniref:Uncharacterized protein n=1 Tax=Photobacterium andalusiense TaxID=2204296 RepID=A0A1Y6MFP1_9GAMM|nr:hypothetical protein [Photobacterium andalusiense]SMY35395.1 hypothetical protein PAND9192_02068 [Photobacterium andalusiense]